MGDRVIRQHYVPVSFLAGFTDDLTRDGNLFVFDKANFGQRKAVPNSVAFSKHLYDYRDPALPVDIIEKGIFAPLEGEFARIRGDIVKNQQIPTGLDYDVFIEYLTLLALRTQLMKGVFHSLIDELIQNGFPPSFTEETFRQRMQDVSDAGIKGHEHYTFQELKESIEQLRQTQAHDKQNTYVTQLLLALAMQKKNFSNRHWSILISEESNQEFVCSDNPVGCYWAKGHVQLGLYPGLETPNSEICVAIHKTMAIKGSFEEPATVQKTPKEEVALMNNRTLNSADRFVFSCKKDFLAVNNQYIVTTTTQQLTDYLRQLQASIQPQ